MINHIYSRNEVDIRLTDERWSHIVEEHNELAGMRLDVLETLSDPERVIQGNHGALMSVRERNPGKYLVVVYTELGSEGFIITAFLTRRINSLNRRMQLWPTLQ